MDRHLKWTMDPSPISFTDKFNYKSCSVYFLQTSPSFDTSNPLCSANQWDWQPHCKLRQSTLVVLCAGFTLLLTPVVRPATSQPTTPSKVTHFSYWSIKPWFRTERKLVAVLITPSSWGFPTASTTTLSKIVWRHHRSTIMHHGLTLPFRLWTHSVLWIWIWSNLCIVIVVMKFRYT